VKQVLCARSVVAPLNSSTTYANPAQSLAFSGTASISTAPWAADGTLSNLIVSLGTAPGSGKSWTFTIVINGSDTAITVTISDAATTARDTTHTASIAPGDTIALKSVPSGTPSALGTSGVRTALEFDGTNAAESGYAVAGNAIHIVSTRYNGLFQGDEWNATASLIHNVAAAAGTVTDLYAVLSAAPGATKSVDFAIYKNGTKQDGSGGTVDTRLSIANAATTGSVSFSLSVAAGDTLYVEAVPVNAPGPPNASIGCAFTATTDGESQVCGVFFGNPFTGGGQWTYPLTNARTSFVDTTEANLEFIAGVTAFDLNKLYVVLNGTPGSGKSYTFSMRKNSSSPGGEQSAAVTDLNTTANDATGSVSLADGDTFAMQVIPSGGPTSRQWSFGMIQSASGGGGGGGGLPNAMLVSP